MYPLRPPFLILFTCLFLFLFLSVSARPPAQGPLSPKDESRNSLCYLLDAFPGCQKHHCHKEVVASTVTKTETRTNCLTKTTPLRTITATITQPTGGEGGGYSLGITTETGTKTETETETSTQLAIITTKTLISIVTETETEVHTTTRGIITRTSMVLVTVALATVTVTRTAAEIVTPTATDADVTVSVSSITPTVTTQTDITAVAVPSPPSTAAHVLPECTQTITFDHITPATTFFKPLPPPSSLYDTIFENFILFSPPRNAPILPFSYPNCIIRKTVDPITITSADPTDLLGLISFAARCNPAPDRSCDVTLEGWDYEDGVARKRATGTFIAPQDEWVMVEVEEGFRGFRELVFVNIITEAFLFMDDIEISRRRENCFD